MIGRLKEQLEGWGVYYELARHPEAFTSMETAAAQHVPGRELAKVVMLRTDEGFVMAVLPSTYRVDLDQFARATGKRARLATEDEFAGLFPDCEPGAMPPFGNLWDIPVWVDRSLTEDRHFWFNAGTHHEAVRLAYEDFELLVQPKLATFAAQIA
jgi:Ala-tRNA(Pro) deacylase